MPQAIAAAVVAAASTYAAGVAGAAFSVGLTAALTSSTIIASALVAGALTGAAAMLMGKPKKASFSSQPANYVFKQSVPAGQIIYGRCRVGGPVVVAHKGESAGHKDSMALVIPVACGEINAVLSVWDGDEPVWNSWSGLNSTFQDKVHYVAAYTGTDSQPVDAYLQSVMPTSIDAEFRGRGIAYIVVVLKSVREKWGGRLPDLWAEVEGLKVRDPRQPGSPFVYTTNWALCMADMMTRDRGGFGFAWDDLVLPELIASANLCDEQVQKKDGSYESRYAINGGFQTGDEPISIINEAVPLGAGQIIDRGGKVLIRAGAYSAPVVSIDENHMVGPLKLFGNVSMEREIDGVKGTYTDPGARYTEDSFPQVVFDDYNPAEGAERLLDLDLSRETSVERAQRVATLAARQAKRRIAAQVAVSILFLGIEAGDRVALSHAPTGLSGTFEVQQAVVRLGPDSGWVELELLEDSESVWLFDGASATVPPSSIYTTQPSINAVDPPEAPLTVSNVAAVGSDGTVSVWVDVTWGASPDFYLRDYVVEWEQGGVLRAASTTAPNYRITGLTTAPVTISVRARNSLLRLSEPITGSLTPQGDLTPPATPGTVNAVSVINGVDFTISPASEPDWAKYRLYEGASGAAFGATTRVDDFASTRYTRLGMTPGVARTFYVTSLDFSGNESGPAGPYTVTPRKVANADLAAAIVDIGNLTQSAIDLIGGEGAATTVAAEAARDAALAAQASAEAAQADAEAAALDAGAKRDAAGAFAATATGAAGTATTKAAEATDAAAEATEAAAVAAKLLGGFSAVCDGAAALTAGSQVTVAAGAAGDGLAATTLIRTASVATASTSGTTLGARIEVPAEAALRFAGRKVRITVRARKPASVPASTFKVAYSTNGDGDSGALTSAALTTSFAAYSWVYTVPAAVAGGTDWFGVWADPAVNGSGVEVSRITITDATEAEAAASSASSAAVSANAAGIEAAAAQTERIAAEAAREDAGDFAVAANTSAGTAAAQAGAAGVSAAAAQADRLLAQAAKTDSEAAASTASGAAVTATEKAAQAQTYSEVAAQLAPGGSVLNDALFRTYPAAVTTDGWFGYSTSDSPGATTVEPQPGGQIVQQVVSDAADNLGLICYSTAEIWTGPVSPAGWAIVVDAEVAGSESGAGVGIWWRDDAAVLRDSTVRIPLSAFRRDGLAGGLARYSIVVPAAIPAFTFGRHDVYLFANYATFSGAGGWPVSPGAEKTVRWHRFLLRPATAEELAEGRVGAAIATAVGAEATARTEALADETEARTLAITAAKSEVLGGSTRTLAQVDTDQATKVTAAQADARADTRIAVSLSDSFGETGAIKAAIDAGDAAIRGGSAETLASLDAKVLARVTPGEAQAIATQQISAELQPGGPLADALAGVVGRSLVVDPRFKTYPSGAGWDQYSYSAGTETLTPQPGGQIVRHTITSASDAAGMVLRSDSAQWVGAKNFEWWAVEIDAQVLSGTESGAGFGLWWVDNTGTIRSSVLRVPLSAMHKSGESPTRYSIVIQHPEISALYTFGRHNLYLFSNYTGFTGQLGYPSSPATAKTIEWHGMSIRPATAEEVGSGQVGSAITDAIEAEDLPSIRSNILSLQTTKVDAAGAVAAINTEIAAATGSSVSTVDEFSAAFADLDGDARAYKGLRIAANGRVASSFIGADDDGSKVVFDADRFEIWNGAAGTAPFSVIGGAVYINQAYIRDADITRLKIAGEAVDLSRLAQNATTARYAVGVGPQPLFGGPYTAANIGFAAGLRGSTVDAVLRLGIKAGFGTTLPLMTLRTQMAGGAGVFSQDIQIQPTFVPSMNFSTGYVDYTWGGVEVRFSAVGLVAGAGWNTASWVILNNGGLALDWAELHLFVVNN